MAKGEVGITVARLIEELKTMPSQAIVCVEGYGFFDPECSGAELHLMAGGPAQVRLKRAGGEITEHQGYLAEQRALAAVNPGRVGNAVCFGTSSDKDGSLVPWAAIILAIDECNFATLLTFRPEDGVPLRLVKVAFSVELRRACWSFPESAALHRGGIRGA